MRKRAVKRNLREQKIRENESAGQKMLAGFFDSEIQKMRLQR